MQLTLKLSKNAIYDLAATLILGSAFSSLILSSRAQIVNRTNEKSVASQQKYRATTAMFDSLIKCEMADKNLGLRIEV